MFEKRASRFGNDRALRFAVVIVEANDNPVPDASQFMGARRIGMKRCEMPTARIVWRIGSQAFDPGLKSFGRNGLGTAL